MSAIGNAIGDAIVAYRTAAQTAFVTSRPKPGPYSPAELAQIASLQARAEGNAIADTIGAGHRIVVGTDPSPNPAQFQVGDIYFLREE